MCVLVVLQLPEILKSTFFVFFKFSPFGSTPLKKFQKTHHIDCKCKLCEEAKKKNDPHMRGLIEDGFKVYVDGDKKAD